MSTWAHGLLAVALAAVWCPPARWRGRTVPVWPAPFALATAFAVAEGFVQVAGLAALAVLSALAWAARAAPRGRGVWAALAGVAAVALAVHAVPGFRNPTLVDGVVLSPGARPFTQYLNFDKGAAGLLLLAAFAPRLRRAAEVRAVAGPTALALLVTATAVLGAATALGLVQPDAKWPPMALALLGVNLAFTCVAEEALFRGLLQRRLPRGATGIAVSAGLFGAVHLAGGAAYASCAALLGLGCAWVVDRTGRIEPAIAVHFGVNAIHFVAFTYPALAPVLPG